MIRRQGVNKNILNQDQGGRGKTGKKTFEKQTEGRVNG
jgi:hypothetical protein